MAELTLLDLVHNGTMDAHTAATLSAITESRRSFLVVAVPRFAGKSTVTAAMLSFVPEGVPLHYLSGDEAEMEQLRRSPDGGYLVVGEFSPAPVPTYIWGSPVRKVFETMRAGYALATALHAPTVEDAFDEVCRGSQVSDEDASSIDYLVYIERMGSRQEGFRRRIAGVYEIGQVQDGVPQAKVLHRWVPEGDRFERVGQPTLLSVDAAALDRRAERIRELVDAGRTAEADARALANG